MRPDHIAEKAHDCKIFTRKSSKMLVLEASKYEDVSNRYECDDTWLNFDTQCIEPIYEINRVEDFTYMAKKIYFANARTHFTTGADLTAPTAGPRGRSVITREMLDMIEKNWTGRCEVSVWYHAQPCAVGSPFERDNKGHAHVNTVFGMIYRAFKHLREEQQQRLRSSTSA